MRYQYQPPPLVDTPESIRNQFTQVTKQLRQPKWDRGHLFVVTLPDIQATAPHSSGPGETGGEGGQADPSVPEPAADVIGLQQPRPNSSLPEGDTIHYVEVPERLLAVRFSMHRLSEESSLTGYVQVRARDWVEEEWLGPVLSSLEAELGRGETEDVGIDLEPGSELGGVYARIGAGSPYHPSRGTLHLLISRR